jgi:glutaminyl-peptide cyclotransferase
MSPFNKLFSVTLLVFLIIGCGNSPGDKKSPYSLQLVDAQKTYNAGDRIKVQLKHSENEPVDSIVYSIDSKVVLRSDNPSAAEFILGESKVGTRSLVAEIYQNGTTYTTETELLIVPEKAPIVYTYEILERYPHDQTAFTQGLEFKNDTLYESTGQKGMSSLRKTDYKTGEVLELVPLSNEYFGEGITILNDKIYQLTWQERTGFIYDLPTLEKTGTFVYNESAEGWGLCNDGTNIYKSDGTEKIWTLNPTTLAEKSYVEIYTNKQRIKRVNELEWVDGKIYANIWERNSIAIVNPNTGAVEGVIDLSGLQKEVTQHANLDVLNGIAYNGEPNILYITGKNWDTLFKIKVVKK